MSDLNVIKGKGRTQDFAQELVDEIRDLINERAGGVSIVLLLGILETVKLELFQDTSSHE